MRRALQRAAIVALGIFVLWVAYDLFLWNQTLSRIRGIESLRGKTVSEAKAFLHANTKSLCVVSLKETTIQDRQFLLVKIKDTGALGVITSFLCSSDQLRDLRISGLITLNIENGIVASTQLVY